MPRCSGCYTELNPGDPTAYWSGPFVCPTCRLRETLEKQARQTESSQRSYTPTCSYYPSAPSRPLTAKEKKARADAEKREEKQAVISFVIMLLVGYFLVWPILKVCLEVVGAMFGLLF